MAKRDRSTPKDQDAAQSVGQLFNIWDLRPALASLA